MLRRLGVISILLVVLLLAGPALAGGWSVVTLDSLPGDVRAGEPLTVGFMVRRHGQTPTNGASPTLSARNTVTGESISVNARQSGESGHYVADVVFSSEGVWEWSIVTSGQETRLAPLTVMQPKAPLAGSGPSVEALPLRETLRWTALATLAAAAFLAFIAVRQRDVVGAPAAGD